MNRSNFFYQKCSSERIESCFNNFVPNIPLTVQKIFAQKPKVFTNSEKKVRESFSENYIYRILNFDSAE